MKAIAFILLSWFLYYVGAKESPAVDRKMLWVLWIILILSGMALCAAGYFLIVE